MTSREPPLDELVWRSPHWAMHFGGIHENTVLYYFAQSPFFDPTSNNASVEFQAQHNAEIAEALGTRDTFEDELDKLNGLEYRVHLGPRDFGGERPIGEGLWVIRKQDRRLFQDAPAQVTVLASYFVVGETIQMAPALGDIFASRLLSATRSLSKVFERASSLSRFTPAFGHHYLPPNPKPRNTNSRGHTPFRSKENTPAPLDQASQLSAQSKAQPAKAADLGTLLDAYAQFNAYGGEYVDDNPLLGEPGNFVFSSSREHVRAKQEAAAKRAQQQADLKKAQEERKLAASRAQSVVPEHPQIKLETTPSRKGSRAPDAKTGGSVKLKRRKTRPGTPLTISASSPA